MTFDTFEDELLSALHDLAGYCGHCGKKRCAGKKSHSTLPDEIKFTDLRKALNVVKAASKKASVQA